MSHDNHNFLDGSLAPHPNDAELRSYLDDRLAEPAHEEVQAHLVDCDQCLSLVKDMEDFFAPPRPAEPLISEDINSEWKRFWNRAKIETPGHHSVAVHERARPLSRLSSPSLLAIAALLLIVLGLGLWVLDQRRQKQLLAERLEAVERQSTQLQVEQRTLTEQLRRAEQEKLDWQERARLATDSRNAQPKEIRTPELNVPIYDLYARDFSRRSANADELNVIKVPETAKSILLLLNGDGLPDSSSFDLEIVSDRGQAIWRGKGLRKGHLGNLTVTVDRTLLAKGTYRLKLQGQSGSKPAEYVIRID